MIPKKFEKKLVLNKKTIVNLGNYELGKVKGGEPATVQWSDCCTGPTWTLVPDDQTPCG